LNAQPRYKTNSTIIYFHTQGAYFLTADFKRSFFADSVTERSCLRKEHVTAQLQLRYSCSRDLPRVFTSVINAVQRVRTFDATALLLLLPMLNQPSPVNKKAMRFQRSFVAIFEFSNS
jgi:hypothetical protein